MKKACFFVALLIVVLITGMFSACGENHPETPQDPVVLDGTEYYAEGIFDTTKAPNSYMGNPDSFTGIVIASEYAETMLTVGVYGKSIVMCSTEDWNSKNISVLANYDQILSSDYDKTNVKLGVLRSGTSYSFFINDTFIVKRDINYITKDCGAGAVKLRGNRDIISSFTTSTDYKLISELKGKSKDLSKSIDIYIIAGQSNASGYATFDYDTMLAIDESLVYGNNNIWYSGRAQWSKNSSVASNEYDWGLARVGQGSRNNCLGAEAGMSTVLRQYYNADSGKIAGIIKFAHGGTALTNNNQTGESGVGGNWTPPSYAEAKGYNYSGLCGKLYRDLLAQVEQRINDLKEIGFTEINIKGIWWSQGQADRNNVKEYPIALEYFISDIRRDLGELVDCDLSDLAFIISELSRTSGSASDSSVFTNMKFINMQDNFAASHDNVYIEENGFIDVNVLENGVSVAVGTDEFHWNQQDAVLVGQMAGEVILNEILVYGNN